MQVKDLIVTGDAKILGNLYANGQSVSGGGGGGSDASGLTYTLTKSGSTITLTGSDGSTSSVTDANTDTNTTYSPATQTSDGLMSAADKTNLNNLIIEIDNVKKSVSDGKTAVANAITNKGVTTATNAEFATMAANIGKISTLSAETADATIAASDVLSGKIGYGKNGTKITGTMTNNGAINATLSANGTYTIPAGYHNGSGKVSQSLTTKAATTYTPGTSNQTIAAGTYLTGVQTIKGDSNLVAGNIAKGKTIFGVTGTAATMDNINGIIESYTVASGQTINAGDFVSYVNSLTKGTDTNLVSQTIKIGIYAKAVALSNTSVFIAFSYTSTGNNYLYGVVCTISGTTITAGSITQLSSTKYTGTVKGVAKLSSTSVFIGYVYQGGNRPLSGMVCTINGTTITAGTATQLLANTNTGDGESFSVALLSSTKVFIGYSVANQVTGMVCTISGTTITAGTSTALNTNLSSGVTVSVCALSDSKVFVVHCYGSKYYLYGTACTINGTTITAGTSKQLSTVESSGSDVNKVVALTDSIALVVSSSGSKKELYGTVCKISGTTVSFETTHLLASDFTVNGSSSDHNLSATKINNTKVFITYCGGGNANYCYLNGITCTVNGYGLNIIDSTQLSNANYSGYGSDVVQLDSSKLFIAHSYYTDDYLYGMVVNNSIYARSYNGVGVGVSSSTASAGNVVSIYSPK